MDQISLKHSVNFKDGTHQIDQFMIDSMNITKHETGTHDLKEITYMEFMEIYFYLKHKTHDYPKQEVFDYLGVHLEKQTSYGNVCGADQGHEYIGLDGIVFASNLLHYKGDISSDYIYFHGGMKGQNCMEDTVCYDCADDDNWADSKYDFLFSHDLSKSLAYTWNIHTNYIIHEDQDFPIKAGLKYTNLVVIGRADENIHNVTGIKQLEIIITHPNQIKSWIETGINPENEIEILHIRFELGIELNGKYTENYYDQDENYIYTPDNSKRNDDESQEEQKSMIAFTQQQKENTRQIISKINESTHIKYCKITNENNEGSVEVFNYGNIDEQTINWCKITRNGIKRVLEYSDEE